MWQEEKSASHANGSSRVDCQIGKNDAHEYCFIEQKAI
jgi:hypothetical protein